MSEMLREQGVFTLLFRIQTTQCYVNNSDLYEGKGVILKTVKTKYLVHEELH